MANYKWVKAGSIDDINPKVGDDVTELISDLKKGVVESLISDGFIKDITQELKEQKKRLSALKVKADGKK